LVEIYEVILKLGQIPIYHKQYKERVISDDILAMMYIDTINKLSSDIFIEENDLEFLIYKDKIIICLRNFKTQQITILLAASQEGLKLRELGEILEEMRTIIFEIKKRFDKFCIVNGIKFATWDKRVDIFKDFVPI